MTPFTTLTATAAPLMRANIDTDTIIRIERLTGTTGPQMAAYVFEALWDDPGFVLRQPPFQGAPILLAGENFGCGSSREGAVWALKYAGIRTVIAPSFGDIFYNNCFQNGLLPVRLPAADVARLAESCAGGNARVTVDLERKLVIGPYGEEIPFDLEELRRQPLLLGLDEIGQTLLQEPAIAAFKLHDQAERPWIWEPGLEDLRP